MAQHWLEISVSAPILLAHLSGPPLLAHGYLQVRVHGHLTGVAPQGFWLQQAALRAGGRWRKEWDHPTDGRKVPFPDGSGLGPHLAEQRVKGWPAPEALFLLAF